MQLKKFIVRFTVTILLPIILLATIYEILFRSIPNTHSYKKNYMDKHAADIEVLFLGNSHAFDGINPAYIDYNSFNLAYHSQEFIFDELLLEKYISEMKSIKCVCFPMSYFTLFEEDIHGWRANKYRLYCDIDENVKLSQSLECFKKENFKFLVDYICYGKNLIVCDSLGTMNKYTIYHNYDWNASGINAAKRHTLCKNGDYRVKNYYILDKIYNLSKEYRFKVIFITYPCWKSYYSNLDDKQWSTTKTTIENFVEDKPNFYYYDFMCDTSFNRDDFMNVDHLNEQGAAKFSKKINMILKEILK